MLLVRFATEDGRTHYMRSVSSWYSHLFPLLTFLYSGVALVGTCEDLLSTFRFWLHQSLMTFFFCVLPRHPHRTSHDALVSWRQLMPLTLQAFSFWYYPDDTVRDVGTCTFTR